MGSSRAGLVACLVTSLVAAPVLAQPTPAQQKRANELVKQAIDRNGQGKHLEAIELYQQAYDLVPLPLLLSNIGTNYQQAGQKPEALKFFCRFLLEEKDVSGVNYQYGKAQALALQIELGNTAATEADPCAAPPPPKPAPPPPPPPPPPPTETPGKGLRLAGLGIAGAGVVALGVGVFYGMRAKSISDDITNHPTTEPWDGNIMELERDGERAESRQIGFLVAGGALAVTGGVVYFLGRAKGSSEQRVTVLPSISVDGAGLVFSGRY